MQKLWWYEVSWFPGSREGFSWPGSHFGTFLEPILAPFLDKEIVRLGKAWILQSFFTPCGPSVAPVIWYCILEEHPHPKRIFALFRHKWHGASKHNNHTKNSPTRIAVTDCNNLCREQNSSSTVCFTYYPQSIWYISKHTTKNTLESLYIYSWIEGL